jgi:hypothetical protein
MRIFICVVILLVLSGMGIYGLDVDYTWSLGDIGIANFNFERNVGYSFRILNWNWIEKNTGLGMGFYLLNQYGYEEGYSWFLLPVEFMWNPLSTRLGNRGIYGTLGIYDKIGWMVADRNLLDTMATQKVKGTEFPLWC